ncbi:MAG: hypothetical protein QM497_04895 [Sulfurimonas sp.]
MKLILLQHLSGAKGTFEVGETVTVNDATAYRYIKKGIATLKTEKELKSFMQKAEAIEAKEATKKAHAKAILESDRLKVELNALYAQVVLKESELKGVVLRDEEIVDKIETLILRIQEPKE